ncbi:hypothetical protein [Anaerolinea sp.]|uniref:hypothetical protein n=1 Tax=Anaerolinea sp. TaxID=1872519 RepID=UPI002ACDDBDA|nr:hypothetical protein [Anaerolinea sp.]
MRNRNGTPPRPEPVEGRGKHRKAAKDAKKIIVPRACRGVRLTFTSTGSANGYALTSADVRRRQNCPCATNHPQKCDIRHFV